jgi:sulfur carrier protein
MKDITINGKKMSYEDHVSLADIAKDKGLADRGVAMARNGEMVHREDWSTTVISEGDDILIIKAFCGG